MRAVLERFGRGFRRMGRWTVARVIGARGYRFEGEQEAHAELARETTISLGLMAAADQNDPDQIRMASEIEHGAENRLTVLLGKARLTMEEKGERDAIQAAISARRQGFAGAPVAAPRRFAGLPAVAGLFGGIQLWMVFGVAAAGALAVWQIDSARLRFDRDRACRAAEVTAGADTTRRPCVDLGETQRQLAHSRDALRDATRMVREADSNAMRTAETLRALERQRQIREQQRRRSQRDTQSILSGVGDPPDLGVRDGGESTPGDSANGDAGNADPG